MHAPQGSFHLAALDAMPELNGMLGGTSVGATPKRVLHVTPPVSSHGRELAKGCWVPGRLPGRDKLGDRDSRKYSVQPPALRV